MTRRDVPSLVGLIGLSLALGGCQPYIEDFEYLPQPAIVELARSTTTQPVAQMKQPLTVYATIVGVRRADPKVHLPPSVEVRLRFDHPGPENVEFDPRSLELLTGELFRFAPPIVEPPRTVSLGSGQSAAVHAYFPFPPGTSYEHVRMGTLLLHWRVRIDGRPVPQSARFHRIDPDYIYDPRRDWAYPYELGYPFVGGNAEVQYPQ